ncbi:MAG: preprotein translocase subunit YajC [Betaproteobacteria bacterium]|nr:preprotein translocase subunit YajC [Betaproteobacteria bacterium]
MSFPSLVSTALAQGAPAAADGTGGFLGFLPIIIMFVLLYFLMIRPQMRRAKEQKAMIEALQKGDEVVAAGGLIGRITRLNDQYATIEIAPNTEITVQRGAVQTPLPKGTIKSLQS